MDRVLIVGAGIAGLTVANALTHAGVENVVFEARDRMGGRLRTVDLDGVPVDLGASWIHTPIGNPMRDFADSVGVGYRPGNPELQMSGYDCGEKRRLAPAEFMKTLGMAFEEFPQAIAATQEQASPETTAAEGIESFLASTSLSGAEARRTRQLIYASVEANAADLAVNQSLRWLWHEADYEGDELGDLPIGGYRALVEAMAHGLDVRLGTEVCDVADIGSGVRLRLADGSTEAGSHVVVTVPLGVLKSGSPRFDPPLPPSHLGAIERLGFGHYEKVIVRFAEPFWHDAGLAHLTIFPADPDVPALWVMDQSTFGIGPALMFHVFASGLGRLHGRHEGEIVSWVLDMLGLAVGVPPPRPTSVAISDWAHDPYARGSYSHIPPGATPSDLDRLSTPHGRIRFAGEHTQSLRMGYADGALSSGLREAAKLLGTDDVHIGRL